MSNFSPMRAGAEEIFTVDFAPVLAPGETISAPVWTIVPVDAIDPNASAMILGTASISGTLASQMISAKAGGIPGVRYAPKCTVTTNNGETLVLPEYGHGLLLVTL